jgi:hypothetical protein
VPLPCSPFLLGWGLSRTTDGVCQRARGSGIRGEAPYFVGSRPAVSGALSPSQPQVFGCGRRPRYARPTLQAERNLAANLATRAVESRVQQCLFRGGSARPADALFENPALRDFVLRGPLRAKAMSENWRPEDRRTPFRCVPLATGSRLLDGICQRRGAQPDAGRREDLRLGPPACSRTFAAVQRARSLDQRE